MKTEAFNFVPVVRGQNRLEVRNESGEHEIVLIGAVGKSWWDDTGITEQEFRDALKTVPSGKQINLRINSEGGSVKEGLGIYNAIKERSAEITSHITGYALSIASVFPLAAGKVISPKSAIWMMHKAWSWAQGNADDMLHAASMLETHDQTLADIYVEHTGKSKDEILDAMKKETWVRGAAAVEFGLADETDSEGDSQAAYRPISPEFLNRCLNLSPELKTIFASANKPTPQGAATNPKEHIMTREKMIALLNKWGVTFDKNATDEQLIALVEAGKPATPAPSGNSGSIITLEEFRAEKRKRIRAEVLKRGENRIANDKIDWWINLAMQDEEGTLAQLDGLPVNQPGGAPVGGHVEIVSEGEYDRISKLATAKARYEAFASQWDTMFVDAQRRDSRGEKPRLLNRYAQRPVAGFTLPQNANTFSATITTAFLLDGVITNLQNRWAPLMAFTRDFSTDPYKPLASHVLKNVTAGTATQTDATNFEAGDGTTIAPVSVTMHQYTQNMSVTNAHLNSGLRMSDLITINSAMMANKIIEVATAPVTKAIFTATPLISAATAFGFSDLATLWGQLKKSPIKNVLLDGEYMARIINQPTFFQSAATVPGGGWKAFGWDYIALNTDWTGAGASTVGFACNPQAIACVAGLPLTPPEGIPGNTLGISTAQVPDIGISIANYSWFSLGTRTAWNSFDIMFGAKEADTTAGVVVASA